MAFEDCYAVDAGTYHARLQRLANSAIAPGVSGVIGENDLGVKGLGSQGVGVMPGAAIVENVYALAAFRQSYLIANESMDDDAILSVPASTGAAARTDYVVLRVFDPEYAGQDLGPEGKGCGLVLTSSIPTSYPCVVLAKVVQPKGNTAGIQQSMITDLRKVANPLIEIKTINIPALATDTGMNLTAASEPGEYFPNGENNTLGPADVEIPKWATRVAIECDWLSVACDANKNAYGRMWVEWGDKTGTSTREKSTQRFQFKFPGAPFADRRPWAVADDVYIPLKYRGTTQRFAPKAMYTSSDKGVSMDALSGMKWKFTFMQIADPEVTER